MKYALINDTREEATKGANGFCPCCGSEVFARCGEVKVNHWAHKGGRNCDPWWENETDWHRAWKDYFPKDWQEVVGYDKKGEKHIADVKTESGCVLEFQHSYLNPEERRSRNVFYPKLVWVVDGTRRKTDKKQFQKILEESTSISKQPPIIKVHFPDECRLLKEWHDSNALVFFDFLEEKESQQSILWFLFTNVLANEAYMSFISRAKFIELHNENKFDDLVKNTILPIREALINKTRQRKIVYTRPVIVPGYRRYMPKKRRKPRFRF